MRSVENKGPPEQACPSHSGSSVPAHAGGFWGRRAQPPGVEGTLQGSASRESAAVTGLVLRWAGGGVADAGGRRGRNDLSRETLRPRELRDPEWRRSSRFGPGSGRNRQSPGSSSARAEAGRFSGESESPWPGPELRRVLPAAEADGRLGRGAALQGQSCPSRSGGGGLVATHGSQGGSQGAGAAWLGAARWSVGAGVSLVRDTCCRGPRRRRRRFAGEAPGLARGSVGETRGHATVSPGQAGPWAQRCPRRPAPGPGPCASREPRIDARHLRPQDPTCKPLGHDAGGGPGSVRSGLPPPP